MIFQFNESCARSQSGFFIDLCVNLKHVWYSLALLLISLVENRSENIKNSQVNSTNVTKNLIHIFKLFNSYIKHIESS